MNCNNILLTGAGYSKNWGGWLASQLWAAILSHSLVQESQELKDIIWDYKDYGFEAIFDDERLKQNNNYASYYQKIIKDSFAKMHKAISGNSDIFNDKVYDFIYWFDSVFTLNQDLFFEALHPKFDQINNHSNKYFYPHTRSRTYCQYERPRDLLRPQFNISSLELDVTLNENADPYDRSNNPLSIFKDTSQISRPLPYYKLHGSLHFVVTTGSSWDEAEWDSIEWGASDNVLVMGGSKSNQIEKMPLLKKYHEDFESHLNEAKKLMIVGYSFSDFHINKKIFDAVEKSGLKFWIIDVAPLKVLMENAATAYLKHESPNLDIRNCASECKWRVECNEWFKKGLISISNQSLRDIFNKNQLELEIIKENFFSR